MSVTKQKSLWGKKAFITPEDRLAARNGIVGGGDDKPSIFFPSPDTTVLWTDFHGDDQTGDDTGKPIYGGPLRRLVGDTGHVDDKVAGGGGVFRILSTPSATAAKASTAGRAIGGSGLDWKNNAGPGAKSGDVWFAARVKMNTVDTTEATGSNRMHVYVGFTDINTYEFPAFDTGAGVISAASDYVGFNFSPGGGTGWKGVGAASTAGDSGDATASLGTSAVPVANTWQVLQFHLSRGISDTGGRATFYIDGKPLGSIDSPVANGVAMAPFVGAWLQDTGTNFLDVDWVNVASARDTGL